MGICFGEKWLVGPDDIICQIADGEVPERFNGLVLKTTGPETDTRVRISPSPL